jgi:hypothetical protein
MTIETDITNSPIGAEDRPRRSTFLRALGELVGRKTHSETRLKTDEGFKARESDISTNGLLLHARRYLVGETSGLPLKIAAMNATARGEVLVVSEPDRTHPQITRHVQVLISPEDPVPIYKLVGTGHGPADAGIGVPRQPVLLPSPEDVFGHVEHEPTGPEVVLKPGSIVSYLSLAENNSATPRPVHTSEEASLAHVLSLLEVEKDSFQTAA